MAPVALQAPAPALHPRFYTAQDVYEQEQAAVFDRSWQLVCHESELAAPGDRLVATVGRHEVIVVRTKDGSLAAHRNVCRHRAARLVDGPGNAAAFRCPYHGWTYHLDGKLVGAPENRLIPCLDKAKLGLLPARADVFLGFVFVSLDLDAVPLGEQAPEMEKRFGRYFSPGLYPITKYRIHQVAEAEVQHANWKVAADNYLEGYHVPVAHPALMRLLDYKRYTVELEHPYALFEVPLRDKPSANWTERLYQWTVTRMPGLTPDDDGIWRYLFLYPNTMLEMYPDMVLAWTIVPRAVDRVAVPGACYGRAGQGLRTRIAQRLNIRIGDITNVEDRDLVARVQRGLATPGYEMGPLSVREGAVAWFADRIRSDLAQLPTTSEGDEP
jgi:Rieske 2Fe-2S family protein